MKPNALKKILTLAAVAAIAAPLAASARPPAQRRAPQAQPRGRPQSCAVNPHPAPHGRIHYRPPHGHHPYGYAAWHWAPPPPPPPPPYWAYYPPPPPPPPVYYYRPGWSVSFGF